MYRTGFAASAVIAALLCASCDYVGTNNGPAPSSDAPTYGTPTPAPSSAPVRAPSASSPGQIRRVSCEDLLDRLDKIRAEQGQPGVDRAVEQTIAELPSKPDWAVLTPDQRQAAVDGTRDAATGKCP
ncbi:hypothetical protein NDR87_15055 [Nocardia sp. CDC159]|uniref:DUF732 domain-containing protein n=1 Tax=Nocardia pulmonis TaxID=2951408 RepID=A0A9X2ECP7_9NOCA|nr:MULTISPECIES: hypothetical protein [Nocardia]MCM6775591.1 hypothetical protein [Nocardia pulmonis]MCM6787675.1 hypothetical protein [Nocardia sp. CDC159]